MKRRRNGTVWVWSAWKRRGILEIAYGAERHHPQYVALHLRSSYFRLAPGPRSAWGTSVVLAPTLWRQGAPGPDQGARVRDLTLERVEEELHLSFHVLVASVRATVGVRLLPPDVDGSISAIVTVEAEGKALLETGRPWDMCKPVMLSSMHVAPDRWDAREARVGKRTVPLPTGDWLLPSPLPGKLFGLRGGLSEWQRRRRVGPAPCVEIALDRTLPVTGWLTPRKSVNDDNLALWPVCSELPNTWTYQIRAFLEADGTESRFAAK